MIYPSNFEKKIGFDRIRELLKENCMSSLGEDQVVDMNFASNFELIRTRLYQTHEFLQIHREEDSFPLGYFIDVRFPLKKIRIEGTYMDESELFDLKRSLQSIRDMVRFFNEKDDDPYPYLKKLALEVPIFPHIIQNLEKILDKYGKLKDNASPELHRIRRELSKIQGTISRRVQSILGRAQKDGLVDKDVNPSIRDGRLVIPIAAANKRRLNGIVHDESATGKTAYIEPAEVVEANNRIRELESAERREIIRILTAVANHLRPEIPDILNSFDFLADIDFIRSKALLSDRINAVLPEIQDKCAAKWEKAIHPLLYLAHSQEGREVVPLEIELDQDQRIILISGPNAGGKSVCLKTVGLLQYMMQCGLLVPMQEDSKMGIFSQIFIDIGDEQSIDNDLSTYSSHLLNMKYFLRHSHSETLLLVDEFGTGTEPQLGGAIAESVLNHLNQKKAFGVITTHYTNLKHFATEASGIVNGAMLYDQHQMQPLFQLQVGKPGSSFAIEIARKIGLPESVIGEASEKIGQDHINFDKHLREIVRDKRYWEQKRLNVRKKEKRLDDLVENYEKDLMETSKLRKEIIRKAKEEAESVISQANRKIENTIREIKESQAEKERTKKARQNLDVLKQKVQEKDDHEDERIRRKMEKIRQKDKHRVKQQPGVTTGKPSQSKGGTLDPEIRVGDKVCLIDQKTMGEVLQVDGKNLVIAFGQIKTTIKKNRVEKVSNNQFKKETRALIPTVSLSDQFREKRLNFKSQIDLRGMRGDEALQSVMGFLDEAIMVGVTPLRILHGTGTGVLRQLIRQYLGSVDLVINYCDEQVQLGGSGITVVDLDL